MAKILVVDDDLEIHRLVASCLDDHELTYIQSAEEAMEAVNNLSFDLVILDITLPCKDGLTLFNEFKASPKLNTIPVIFLTSKSEIKDKVLGLQMGAEDYITKPFDRQEFKARIELRILKAKEKVTQQRLVRSNLILETSSRRLFLLVDGKEKEVQVTTVEFRILYFLLSHENETITRQQLLQNLWGDNINVVDRVIDAHICNIRKKISATPFQIKSVYAKGYRLSERRTHVKKVAA